MRRFIINSNNVNYNKRKRRYVTAGVDEVSTEGVPSFGQQQYQWQGQQGNYSNTVSGTNDYSTPSSEQPKSGGGMGMIPIIGWADKLGGMGSDVINGLNKPGGVDAYGVPINKEQWINKTRQNQVNANFSSPTKMISWLASGAKGAKRQYEDLAGPGNLQRSRDIGQQQLEDYRIDNPYRENQATFAMGGENNMSQSNELNSFNGGDGSQDSIERPNSFVNNKETEHKNVIHSNSFVITPEMAEHYNLPDSVIDKTPSEASLILSKDTIRTKPQHNEQKLLHTSNIKDQFVIAADKANKRNEVGIYALDKLSKEIGELLNPQQQEQPEMQQQNVPDDMTLNGGMAYGGIHIKKSHRGLLHKNLGVKEGEKIPASKLVVKSTDSPAVKKRKIFAKNTKHFKH